MNYGMRHCNNCSELKLQGIAAAPHSRQLELPVQQLDAHELSRAPAVQEGSLFKTDARPVPAPCQAPFTCRGWAGGVCLRNFTKQQLAAFGEIVRGCGSKISDPWIAGCGKATLHVCAKPGLPWRIQTTYLNAEQAHWKITISNSMAHIQVPQLSGQALIIPDDFGFATHWTRIARPAANIGRSLCKGHHCNLSVLAIKVGTDT
jgi:hypothetical protein